SGTCLLRCDKYFYPKYYLRCREKTLKAGNYHEGKRLSYQYNLKNNIDKITPPAKCGGVIVVTAD
ncbi:hypothetical protein LWT73_24695, partial [Enterobacter hormaechei]|nr:hypothetical protein [Enterobacter hormaechei]